MHEKNRLEELLERDKEAKRFYDSLSPTLRKRLDSFDTSSFLTLMKASMSAEASNVEKETVIHVASSSENTGMISAESDLSEDKWRRFGELSQ